MEEPHPSLHSVEEHSARTAEMLRAMREQADHTLETHLSSIEQIEAELGERIQLIVEGLARDQAADEQATQERDQLAEALQELRVDYQELSHARDQLAEQLEVSGEQRDEASRERERLTGEFQQLQQDADQTAEERNRLTEEVGRLSHELADLRHENESLNGQQGALAGDLDQLRLQLETISGERDQLNEEQATANTRRAELEQSIHSLQGQLESEQRQHEATRQAMEEARQGNDELDRRVAASEQLVVELKERLEQQEKAHANHLAELSEQSEQTSRKCELALSDVHKLKKANAELHEELAQRPAAEQQDSSELVCLRTERDALAARVEELENAPAAQNEGDAAQEFKDLQRRFELAVEDVRSLKQENASLREKLESASTATAPTADLEAMDWQAQKARLLAELDAEDGGETSAERQEERATIDGTILITDRVVGEKDREIAQLRKRLESVAVGGPSEADLEAARQEALQAAHEELFSRDEVIQAERARLQALQNEWNDKLRTAELEISVQRATLAREQAQLEEKLRLVETKAADHQADGQPKRRWLSALGIRDDKEDEK